ncbi:hypothetical protein TCON_2491 [Astathelohania contejeani]|uniref:Chromatin assembly factor 1 subunit A dimerization domain-containing protein n=1 Tax=Astathelohania contejeani TaxID=164912 RepID=A0ABQ7HVW2_9MICR|nr:hypothetical protein TCON_2491 [Thelohania contejeani]
MIDYHPAVLKSLYEFKLRSDNEIPDELLVAILEAKTGIDIRVLDSVIFDFKSNKPNKKSREKILLEKINELFQWRFYSSQKQENAVSKDVTEDNYHKSLTDNLNPTSDNGIWVLESKNVKFEDSQLKAYIMSVRKKARSLYKRKNIIKQGDGSIDNKKVKKDDDMPKQENSKTNSRFSILNFAKINEKITREDNSEMKFRPIKFDDNTVVYKVGDVIESIRRPPDIEIPKRLTFIKFYNQIRPPLYEFYSPKLKIKNSLKKIDLVEDYDFDSDLEWENNECDNIDAEILDSTESEEEDDEEYSNSDFIDDSEEESQETQVAINQPHLTKPECIYHQYKNFDEEWLRIPLIEYSTIPDNLIDELKKEYKNNTENQMSFIKNFGKKHYIKQSVLLKKIKEFEEIENSR